MIQLTDDEKDAVLSVLQMELEKDEWNNPAILSQPHLKEIKQLLLSAMAKLKG